MRPALGFAGTHLAFAVAGMALLFALGLVRRPRQLPAALGPAYVCGLAAVMPVLILLLVIGAPVTLPTLFATVLVLTAALGAVGVRGIRRGRAPEAADPPAASPVELWATRVAVAAVALFAAVGSSAFAKIPTLGDDFSIWSAKAIALFSFDGRLNHDVFAGGALGPPHLDYPLFQPLLESLFYRAMDGLHLQEMHMMLWILFIAFIWTVGFLLRERGVPAILMLPPLAVLVVAPGSARFVATGYADVPVGCFVALGALCVGLWLDDGPREYALLGGVFLAAAANIKNEGLIAAVFILATALAVTAVTRSGRWRPVLTGAAIAAAGAAPWVIWRSSHGIANDDVHPLATSLDWHFLTSRLDRLSAAAGKVVLQLADQAQWSWIAPCFLALAIVCLVTGSARRQAVFYLVTATLMALGLLWVYWTGKLRIGYWLTFSANRVTIAIVFVSAVGLVHLVALLLRAPTRSATPEP
jgi:hypothetical protein